MKFVKRLDSKFVDNIKYVKDFNFQANQIQIQNAAQVGILDKYKLIIGRRIKFKYNSSKMWSKVQTPKSSCFHQTKLA